MISDDLLKKKEKKLAWFAKICFSVKLVEVLYILYTLINQCKN